MRLGLHFFVKLMHASVNYYNKICWYYNILCMTYFVASLTMPDPQSSNMRHIR